MNNTGSENTGEFIRRRFSLTHEVNDLIDELAEGNHGGNRSACVRAAVYAMHQRRDEDELRHGQKRLQKAIEALTEQVESLQEADSFDGELHDQSQSGKAETTSRMASGEKLGKRVGSKSNTRIAREVYHVMRDLETTVFDLNDLLGEVEYSLAELAEGIELLIQQGAVEQLNTDTAPQYRLTDS